MTFARATKMACLDAIYLLQHKSYTIFQKNGGKEGIMEYGIPLTVNPIFRA